MPVPDFSPGEVLTAAAMDSIGMWLVKRQTIGSAVSSVAVTDAFSADYDQYLITLNGGASSATTDINFRLGSVVTGYRYNFVYGSFNNTVSGEGLTTATSIRYIGSGSAANLFASATVLSPFLTTPTNVIGIGANISSFSGFVNGFEPNNTSFTGFTLFPGSGTLTGGTIRVYGYRN
jgi:hypothetical protein